MKVAGNSIDSESFTGAQLPIGDALSSAFLALKQQFDDQSTLSDEKSDVIRLQQALITMAGQYIV